MSVFPVGLHKMVQKTPLCDYCDRYLDCDVIHEQWEGPFLHQNFHFRRKTMEIVMMWQLSGSAPNKRVLFLHRASVWCCSVTFIKKAAPVIWILPFDNMWSNNIELLLMRRLPRTWHSCSWGNYGDDANCSEWAERIWVQTSSLCLFFQQHSAGAHKTLNNISMRLLFSGIKALYLASEQESVQRVFVCGTRVCVYMCVQGTIKNVPLLFFF